jgi:hypothetical protein
MPHTGLASAVGRVQASRYEPRLDGPLTVPNVLEFGVETEIRDHYEGRFPGVGDVLDLARSQRVVEVDQDPAGAEDDAGRRSDAWRGCESS